MFFLLSCLFLLSIINAIAFFASLYYLIFSIGILITYFVIHVFTISKFVMWFVIGFVCRFIRKYIKKKYYYPELKHLYNTSPDFNQDFFLRMFYYRYDLIYVDEPVMRPMIYYIRDILNDLYCAYLKISQVIHAFFKALFIKYIKPHLSEDLLKDKRPLYKSYFSDKLRVYADPEDEYEYKSSSIFSEVLIKKEIEPEVYQEFYQSIIEKLLLVLIINLYFIVISYSSQANKLGDNFNFDEYLNFLHTVYAALFSYLILFCINLTLYLLWHNGLKDFLKYILFEGAYLLLSPFHRFYLKFRPKVESFLFEVLYYPFSICYDVYKMIRLFFTTIWSNLKDIVYILNFYYLEWTDYLIDIILSFKFKFLHPLWEHKLYPYFLFFIILPISVLVFEFIFLVILILFFL